MLGIAQKAWLLVCCVALLLAGCSIDSHLQDAVKLDDPFAIDDERDFVGLVVQYLALPNGESTLIRMPGGKTLLVDTGAAEDWRELLALLTERKLTLIDYVVLTNDQPAQIGGFPFLSEQVRLDTVIIPRLIQDTILREIRLRTGQKLVALSAGDELAMDEHVTVNVLHPSEHLFLSPQDNSLVFQLKHDKLRFLFTSAINEKAEERLLERYPDMLKAEVLKVADQGSNQASSQPFLSKVDPQVAVIQTGKPRDKMKDSQEEVIERLGESWAETYITSQHGTITILSNGKDYRILKRKQ